MALMRELGVAPPAPVTPLGQLPEESVRA
jgi:hypothetical protein